MSATRATLGVGLLAVVAAGCIPSMRRSYREGTELMERALDARDLTGVRLDAGVGNIEVRAGGADSVRVRVVLRSQDADRLANECIPRSELRAERDGAVLALKVEQHTRNQCGADWRIEMPAALHARIDADLGDITVAGLTGGIHVENDNGDIDVRSAAEGHGRVAVRSDNGRVRVRLMGYEVPVPSKPGPSSELTIDGPGGPAITLRTRLGQATLTVER